MTDFIDNWGIPNRPDHSWNEYDLLTLWKSCHVEMTTVQENAFLANPIIHEIIKFNTYEISACFNFSSDLEDAIEALRRIDYKGNDDFEIEQE